MRISDWSSDVCSSDLLPALGGDGFSLAPWAMLLEQPGLGESLRLTLVSGFLATLVTFTLTVLLLATCHALEQAVHWLYANDRDLRMPYDNSLGVLLTQPAFEQLLPPHIHQKARLIQKLERKG